MPASPKRFKRVIENFRCFNCKTLVKGTGYTDHCPRCLWSRHVDNNPGDRASGCGGKMRPAGASYSNGSYTIQYICAKCGANKKFKAAENDNKGLIMMLLSVSSETA